MKLCGTQELMSVPYALYAKTAGNGLTRRQGDQEMRELKGFKGIRDLKVFKEIRDPGYDGPQGIKESRDLKVFKVRQGSQGIQGDQGPKVFRGAGTQGIQGDQGPPRYQGIRAQGTRDKDPKVFKEIRGPQVFKGSGPKVFKESGDSGCARHSRGPRDGWPFTERNINWKYHFLGWYRVGC